MTDRGPAEVSPDGPGLHPTISVGTVVGCHALVLAMLRRLLVQRGHAPGRIEQLLGQGNSPDSHAELVRHAAGRLGIPAQNIFGLALPDLRRIGQWLARKVNPNSSAWPHYPDGWQADREKLNAGVWTPPKQQREPGDDDT